MKYRITCEIKEVETFDFSSDQTAKLIADEIQSKEDCKKVILERWNDENQVWEKIK